MRSRDPRGDRSVGVLTRVILSVFRLNGQLLRAGDELVGPLGLTSARWQMLGAVALSDRPLTAPQLGDIMGVTRQGAQKQLDLLVDDGFMERRPNPDHLRSPLYALTPRGRSSYEATARVQARWAARLAAGLALKDLETAAGLLWSLGR